MTVRLLGVVAMLAGAAVFAASAQAAGDPAKGRIKSQTCMGCHGIAAYTTIYPEYRVPKVAGQHADYIVSALKEYASGKRAFATMQAQASALSDADMQDIAAYFESLGKGAAGDYGADEAKANKLAQTCAACHGKTGVSTVAQFPILAGQYENYLLHALDAYKKGTRQNSVMKGMVADLSADDMKVLAAYFRAQRSPLRVLPRPAPAPQASSDD